MLAGSRQAVSTLTVILLLAMGAVLATVWFAAPATRNLVPVVFVVIVVLVALRFGALAGIVGSLVGAAIFAGWLYAPVGSLHVKDTGARDQIGWMVLAGISLSYLLAPKLSGRDHKH